MALLSFLCATSVFSVSLWLLAAEKQLPQRTQRLHREKRQPKLSPSARGNTFTRRYRARYCAYSAMLVVATYAEQAQYRAR
jgi:hypothetical protein